MEIEMMDVELPIAQSMSVDSTPDNTLNDEVDILSLGTLFLID